jgi:nitronate monooxygenase
MGAGVSNWRLAQAVSRLGQLGVVSGTALGEILSRRLQDGDPDGHMRRALSALPLRNMARRVLNAHFRPAGRRHGEPYRTNEMLRDSGNNRAVEELCIAGNFAEVYLAREGHSNPVGINYLEKIQLPHLPSVYGAMLAGVGVIVMGAGIPLAIPAVINAFAANSPATYPLSVAGGENVLMEFDPRVFAEDESPLPPLPKPYFVPIVASSVLATMLDRKCGDAIAGFVVEGPTAGGHNAPPRGALKLTSEGEPIYGPRDVVDLTAMRELGRPFWLAGGYGSADRLADALAAGAAGVQVGTAFALCIESGLIPEVRHALISIALSGHAKVRTDPTVSPTGFPFKVARLEGTLSEKSVYEARRRVCDLGFLRGAYRRNDGQIGFRCAAESESSFIAKGGPTDDTHGRACLCNALLANIGLGQNLRDGTCEPCLITLGDDMSGIGRFCTVEKPDYTAEHVVDVLLG